MICNQCNQQFEYFPGEKDAYAKFELDLPKNCPTCRQLRRMAFRNEKTLYYNKSTASGKQIIALYPPDSPFQIIDEKEWWWDKNDSAIYGQDFDFNRPFFEQFAELQLKVPRWSRASLNNENSEFTNNCAYVNNSYLSFSSHHSENIFYCMRAYKLKDCIDCVNCGESELCSRCVDCQKLYNTHYSQLTENCTDCYLLFDCKGCDNCMLCSGIRNGEYMILNEKHSKDEYEKFKQSYLEKFSRNKEEIIEIFEELKRKTIHKNLHNINSENVTGDFIINSKNLRNCFNVSEGEDCINNFNCDGNKNCYDNSHNDKSELCIECDTAYELYNLSLCTYIVGCKNSKYLDQCFYLENSFGCVGLKKQTHMILNKKYSPEDYKEMVEKIEDHMKRTGEYGQPFPLKLSSFAYNETVAQELAPLTREQAAKGGLRWYEKKEEAAHYAKKHEISENMEEIDETICDKILTCRVTGKNYKIIPQEYRFYKKLKLPIPVICPDQRYKELMALKNPQKLRKTKCENCSAQVDTTYPENSPYKIYCEECYLKKVY